MMKRKTKSKKTLENLQWIKDNEAKYMFKADLIKAIAEQFNLNERYTYRLLEVYLGIRQNTGTEKPIDKQVKFKSVINLDNDGCYFCKDRFNLVRHHISYAPEQLVWLCNSCHSKIHFIMQEQHRIEQERANRYLEIANKFKIIKTILGD